MKEQRINLEFLNSFTIGDHKKMIKYINMFLISAPIAIETMLAQYQNSEWNNLKTTAHSLKPQLAYMGIDSLKETIMQIEYKAGEAKNTMQIPGLIEDVKVGCDEAFIELHAVIKTLSIN